MKVGQCCKAYVISIGDEADIVAAAQRMRDEHVGFLVVHKEGDELRKPVGVLTDRDIVLQVTAPEVDPHSVTAKDVMSRQPVMASSADDLSETLQAMRIAGVRRIPVVDVRGALIGILALDDAIDLVTGLLCDVSGSIKNEQRMERRRRSPQERTSA